MLDKHGTLLGFSLRREIVLWKWCSKLWSLRAEVCSGMTPPLPSIWNVTHYFTLVFRDEIHLVHETEYLGVGRVLENGLQTGLVIVHVLLNVSALHIKDIYEHLHIPEHIITLTGEVVLHESFLPVVSGEECAFNNPWSAHCNICFLLSFLGGRDNILAFLLPIS